MKNKKARYVGTNKLYSCYNHMKARCYNPKDRVYKYYGARGIKICDEWLDSKNGYDNFENWALVSGYKETKNGRNKLTLDRIDNNGNYCPENCRWVSHRCQMNNTRNNKIIEYNGEKHTLSEWSRILKINVNILESRLRRNIPWEQKLKHRHHNQVIQKDMHGNIIKIWKSATEVEKNIGIGHSTIAAVCLGKRKTANGFIWEYFEKN